MPKRDNRSRKTTVSTASTKSPVTTTASPIEQRVVAFGELLGWIAGTVQARAEGWMDRDTLSRQIVSVRDGASELLEDLAGIAAKDTTKKAASTPDRGGNPRGSRGPVDAPGKKHRKAPPRDPGSNTARSQTEKMRTASTMVKTHRRRGRG